VAPELVEEILRDLAPCPADGLPLLSRLLFVLWHRRVHHGIDMPQYRACGGLAGVAAELAVTTRRTLDPHMRPVADHIIARIGGQTSGLDAGQLLSDVDGWPPDHGTDVLARLTAARMVTIDGDVVRLCHRAMLDAWPHRQPTAVGTTPV
jgi:hypothetical protein